jgi:hypothetical protein
MLIIEGPDLVGKTTLCKRLLEYLNREQLSGGISPLGYIYSHFTRLPRGFDYYWDYVNRMSTKIVQDRFHLSEIIYSQVRGESRSPLTPEMYRLVDAQLRLLGGFTVVVTAEPHLIQSRYEARKETEMYNLDKVMQALELFRSLGSPGSGFEHLGYYPDIDMHLHCHEDMPYVSDHWIGQVAQRYLARQSQCRRIARLRPSRLQAIDF